MYIHTRTLPPPIMALNKKTKKQKQKTERSLKKGAARPVREGCLGRCGVIMQVG